MHFEINRSNWKEVSLEETVIRREENDKDRAKDRFDTFIKVEHMDAESLHLKRWGLQGDEELPPTFYKIFRKGQILFPTRNPHLRRTALATFDGICGEKTLTLEPNPQMVDPAFLPFLFHSERFVAHTTSSIIGSTNPHVRWRDVAKFEFLLPPKDQQARLAELLWAADDVVEKYLSLENQLRNFYEIAVEFFFKGGNEVELTELAHIAKINSKSLSSSTPSDYRFRYLDIAGIIEPKVIGELQEIEYKDSPSRARRVVNDGDIVLSLVRPYHNSFVLIKDAENIIASTGTGVISVNEGFNNSYIFHQFFTKRFAEFCKERMTGTNYPAITPKDLAEFKVRLQGTPTKQKAIANKLDFIDKSRLSLKEVVKDSKQLQKSLINQIF